MSIFKSFNKLKYKIDKGTSEDDLRWIALTLSKPYSFKVDYNKEYTITIDSIVIIDYWEAVKIEFVFDENIVNPKDDDLIINKGFLKLISPSLHKILNENGLI